ncbi:TPA: hypothetical protein HA225_04920 [Candidatus Micrarchaeota archaeon]|nr:hypothetical protein [Candidatus Micrarchaeota archaeon]HIH31010.1 hypothetical protein [Candidatus Micrarchaeota archaeon]
MRQLLFATLVFSLFILSGCARTPSECSSVAPSRFANCVYLKAVTEQDPFHCYSLSDTNQRAICIRDAANSAARESLLRATPEQRALIFFSDQPVLPVANETPKLPPGPSANQTDPQQGLCGSLPLDQKEQCLRDIAVGAKDMAACEGIAGPAMRQSCITTIARTLKSPEICLKLSQSENIDLCNLYSKAGE